MNGSPSRRMPPSPCELVEPVVRALRAALPARAEAISLHMLLAIIAERRVFGGHGGRMAEFIARARAEPIHLWRDFRHHILALRHSRSDGAASSEAHCGWLIIASVFSSFDALFDSGLSGYSYETEDVCVSPTDFQSALCALGEAVSSEQFNQNRWPCAIGEIYAGLILGKKARGASGSYYTPKLIAAKMAKECIDAYCKNNPNVSTLTLSCVDPSMGCGSLLIRAIEYLHQLDPSVKKSTLVAKCAYGADVDGGAVDVGRFCLSICAIPPLCHNASEDFVSELCQDLRQITKHLIVADTLLSTRKFFSEQSSEKDLLAVEKCRSIGLPVVIWDEVWPEQFTTDTSSSTSASASASTSTTTGNNNSTNSTNSTNSGFACFISNPPYLKKASLSASYKASLSTISGAMDFTHLNVYEMLSSRFACWRQSRQPNVFTMFVESSIHLLRTCGAGVIISPGALLVHDSIKYFRRRFFGPLSCQDSNLNGTQERLLQVAYVGDLRGNAHLFEGCECYPTILGFLCDPSHSASALSDNQTIIVETLRKRTARKRRARKRKAQKREARGTDINNGAGKEGQLDIIISRCLGAGVLKTYPFWRTSYSLAPLLSIKRPPLALCRSDAEFLPLNSLLDVRDRLRKDAALSRIYQLHAYQNATRNQNKSCHKSRTVHVVVSSSVGRHASLWGRKTVKLNNYVEVQVPGSAIRTKTQRVPGEHIMCSRPFFKIDEKTWVNTLSDADRDLLSSKKLIFATMCSSPRCFYASALTLPYCLPTARFNESLYQQVCGNGRFGKSRKKESESRELFMMYIASCLNSDIINSWIMEVHGSDSMNNNCKWPFPFFSTSCSL